MPDYIKSTHWRFTALEHQGQSTNLGCGFIDVFETRYGQPIRRKDKPARTLVATPSAASGSYGSNLTTVFSDISWAGLNSFGGHYFDPGSVRPALTLVSSEAVWADSVIWWSNLGTFPTVLRAESSADGGSTWVTQWEAPVAYQGTGFNTPSIFQNPEPVSIADPVDLALFDGQVSYMLDPSGQVYSDPGITPIADGQPVYRVVNPGTYAGVTVDIDQPTAGSRPIWKSEGRNGRPYFKFDGVDDFLGPVVDVQPGGITGQSPFAAFFVGDIDGPVASGSYLPIVAGVGVAAGKSAVSLGPGNATGLQARNANAARRYGTWSSDRPLLATFVREWSTFQYWVSNGNPGDISVSSGSGDAHSQIQFFGSAAAEAPRKYFQGDVYGLLILKGSSRLEFIRTALWADGYFNGLMGGVVPAQEYFVPKASLTIQGKNPVVLLTNGPFKPQPATVTLEGKAPALSFSVTTNADVASVAARDLPSAIGDGFLVSPTPQSVAVRNLGVLVFQDYGMLTSQVVTLAYSHVTPHMHATQSVVLAFSKVIPEMEFSQVAVLRYSRIIPEFKITQAVALTLVRPKVSLALMPEPANAVTETWEWKTDVIVANDGTEQRISLRENPKRSASFDVEVFSASEANDLAKFVALNSVRPYVLPVPAYNTRPKSRIKRGDYQFHINTVAADIRVGEHFVVRDPVNKVSQRFKATKIEGDMVMVDTPSIYDFSPRSTAYQAWLVYPRSGGSFSRKNGDDYSSFVVNSAEYNADRPLPTGSPSLPVETFDGIPILLEPQTGESFNTDNEAPYSLSDSIGGTVALIAERKHPHHNFTRNFVLHRVWDAPAFERFRVLAQTIRGSQKVFLLCSNRNDVNLREPIAPGSKVVKVEGLQHGAAFFGRASYRRIRIETDAGVHCANVWSSTMDGNHSLLHISPPLPSGSGWERNQKVSFLTQVRIQNDKVVLEHYSLHTVITMALRTVDDELFGT